MTLEPEKGALSGTRKTSGQFGRSGNGESCAQAAGSKQKHQELE